VLYPPGGEHLGVDPSLCRCPAPFWDVRLVDSHMMLHILLYARVENINISCVSYDRETTDESTLLLISNTSGKKKQYLGSSCNILATLRPPLGSHVRTSRVCMHGQGHLCTLRTWGVRSHAGHPFPTCVWEQRCDRWRTLARGYGAHLGRRRWS
jgi:hypothetical protein